MGGGWSSRCLRWVVETDALSPGRGVWRWVSRWSRATPSFVVLVSCLLVTLCKAVVCTGLFASESHMATSSSVGGCVCAPTGQRINDPRFVSGDPRGVCPVK